MIMINQITKTASGYEIILEGQTLSVPEATENRHYQMILEAISNGHPVLDPPLPPAPTQAEQQALRQAAYTSEADPLFFKWQAGEATKEEWEAKRQEIRGRFPYPEEAAL